MLHIITTSPLSANQAFLLAGMAIISFTIVVTTVTKLITDLLDKLAKTRAESLLKQQIINSGISADEMARLLSQTSVGTPEATPAFASEVVVERDGEWASALALAGDADRIYVHYVGEDMSSNEWVSARRLRFPHAASQPTDQHWTGMPSYAPNGTYPKPAPIETDL